MRQLFRSNGFRTVVGGLIGMTGSVSVIKIYEAVFQSRWGGLQNVVAFVAVWLLILDGRFLDWIARFDAPEDSSETETPPEHPTKPT